jgi:hypothetical protein
MELITCPITQDVMTDPVQGNDGQTYEREAIVQALRIKKESPITRAPMTLTDLTVNYNIRTMCQKYHNGEFGTPDAADRTAPKVSSDTIKLVHTAHKNTKDTIMLNFDIDYDTFPEEYKTGYPHDVVIAIDRSGSMCSPIGLKDVDGNKIENNFSTQDIVNHAVKTVTKTFDQKSRISLIVFDSEIELLFDLLPMVDTNKDMAIGKIDNIIPGGQTNIWGAIEKAIHVLHTRDDKTRNGAILMFTDGIPNISPSRGEIETLKRLKKNMNFTSPIYAFGFGNNLKKDLLYDFAKYGVGGIAHIPDGTMIATVFCNFIATIFCSVALNLQLHIVPPAITAATSQDTTSQDTATNLTTSYYDLLMGDFAVTHDAASNEYIYDIGAVQIEQSRNIVLNTNQHSEFTYYYSYKIGGNVYKSETYEISPTKIGALSVSPEVDIHVTRFNCVQDIRKMINYNNIDKYSVSSTIFEELVGNMHQHVDSTTALTGSAPHPLMDGLLKNFEGSNDDIKKYVGQVKMAIEKQYYGRWGNTYLDQLSRSLNQQIKPNFKDESCVFGKEIFDNLVDKASDIFDTLPPPVPSLSKQQHSPYQLPDSYSGSSFTSLPPLPSTRPIQPSMSVFNDPGGGCIANDCLITLADNTKIPLFNLKPGNEVLSYTSEGIKTAAKVVCIVETVITSGVINMVEFANGLKITPWHPIKLNFNTALAINLYTDANGFHNNWVFPNDVHDHHPSEVSIKSMITLVLDNHHIAIMNDTPCIMMGHNFKTKVLAHPYYGSNLAIADLKTHSGWEKGHIVVNDTDVQYIKENKLTSKIIYKS